MVSLDVEIALNDLPQIWIPALVILLGAIGALIAVIDNSRKARLEAKLARIKLEEARRELTQGQENIQAQFRNNGGSTLKDSVDSVVGQIKELRKDISGIRRDVGRLSEVDILDRTNSERDVERFYLALSDVQKQLVDHIKDVPNIMQKAQEDTIKIIKEQNNATKQ